MLAHAAAQGFHGKYLENMVTMDHAQEAQASDDTMCIDI